MSLGSIEEATTLYRELTTPTGNHLPAFTPTNSPFRVHIVRTPTDCAEVGRRLVNGGVTVVGLDVETDTEGDKPHDVRDHLVGIGIAIPPPKITLPYDTLCPRCAAVFPAHVTICLQCNTPTCGAVIPPPLWDCYYGELSVSGWPETLWLLKEKGIGWYGHNSKYDYTQLLRHGIDTGPPRGDSMLAAYLSGEREAALKDLVARRYGHRMTTYEEVVGIKGTKISTIPIEATAPYSCEDAYWSLRMGLELEEGLKKQGGRLWSLYRETDVPLIEILVRMQLRGVLMDKERITADLLDTIQEVQALDHTLCSMAKESGYTREPVKKTCRGCRNGKKKKLTCTTCNGEGVFLYEDLYNPGSGQQTVEWLHGILKLPVQGLSRKTHEPSMDALALLRLQVYHPAPTLLLRRRGREKYGDFLGQWLEGMDSWDRLYTTFTNTWVRSGRLSSRQPNLQQVSLAWRKHFIAKEGATLVAGDYGQLEVRVAAFVSRDPELMRICNAELWPDNDLHAQTMKRVFNISFDEQGLHKPLRVTAKTMFFAQLFGGGVEVVLKQLEKAALKEPELGIIIPSKREAQGSMEAIEYLYRQYFREYKAFALAKAREDGNVAYTAFGRPRVIPDLGSRYKELREVAEREAISMAVQGTAADLVRKAMQVTENIPKGELLLQVHDELLCEVDGESVDWYTDRLREAMELGQPLEGVPLVVTIKAGQTWEETHG